MWAGLIANATDPSKAQEIPKVYIAVLSGLDPLDALLLKEIRSLKQQGGGAEITLPVLLGRVKQPAERVKVALANLHRLGCIAQNLGTTWDGAFSGGLNADSLEGDYYLTNLGRNLLDACDPERGPQP